MNTKTMSPEELFRHSFITREEMSEIKPYNDIDICGDKHWEVDKTTKTRILTNKGDLQWNT